MTGLDGVRRCVACPGEASLGERVDAACPDTACLRSVSPGGAFPGETYLTLDSAYSASRSAIVDAIVALIRPYVVMDLS